MAVQKTLNTLNTFTILDRFDVGLFMRKQKASKKRKNIVLKIPTYERLERYKVALIKEKGNPKVTFDDVVNDLLNKTEKGS